MRRRKRSAPAAFFALGAVVLVVQPLDRPAHRDGIRATFLVLVLFAGSPLALDDRDDAGGRRKALCCVFAVLLVLCRQDYVIVAGTLVASLFVIRILGRRHEPLSIVVREELRRSLPVFGAVVLGLVISFSLYFAIDGTLVPVSGLVKLHQGVPHGLTGFLNRFLGALLPFSRFWASSNTAFGFIGAAAMVVLAVFVIANRDHLRSPRLAGDHHRGMCLRRLLRVHVALGRPAACVVPAIAGHSRHLRERGWSSRSERSSSRLVGGVPARPPGSQPLASCSSPVAFWPPLSPSAR